MSVQMIETSESRRVLAGRCWEAFYHRYAEKLQDKATPSAERGRAAHLALQALVLEMLKMKKLIKSTGREVKVFAEEACRKELTPVLQPKGVLDEISPMVRYGLLGFDPADYDIIIPEMEFDFEIDESGHRLRGKIDLFLVRKDGVVVIVDYKTGSPYDAEGDIQLATYALAARDKGYKADQIQCCLKFLGDKQVKITSFSDDYLDYVLTLHQDHCEEVDRRLAVGQDAFPAKPTWFCEWCAYKGACSRKNAISLVPNTYNELSSEKMKELMEWVLVVEPLLSEAKALIKQMAEDVGFIEVNGEYFGMFPSVSREFNAEQLFMLFGNNGIFDMSVFKVDVKKLDRNYAKNPLWGEIDKLTEEITRRNFGHKAEPPYNAKVVLNVAK